MSTPSLLADPALHGDILADARPAPAPTKEALPDSVASHVVAGTSVLGLSVFLERGCGFLANILAARFAGAPAFGAYSLAISTANNISTYAAGGIGATATRFSGKYGYGSSGYATLGRALAIVSLVSATLAGLALWFGAAPIAGLLHKPGLVDLLRFASLSAAGIILVECARGFFVGQRRLAALIVLSLFIAVGMISLLPAMAATRNSEHMIVAQGTITVVAVAACVLFARPLGLFPMSSVSLPLKPVLREVWSFGFIQLAGLVSANLAGWWLMALVARSDASLTQMSFFAIASQLRNLAGIAPGLLTEGSYASMAHPDEEDARTPHRVMALCAFAATGVSLVMASLGILVLPWALRLMYGGGYATALNACALGLAVAVVHMGNAPAAARLTVVSIRATGVINTLWALLVAGSATVFFLHHGSAAQAMLVFFAAHLVSAALVLIALARLDHIPSGVTPLFALSTVTMLGLALLSWLRETRQMHLLAGAVGMLLWIGLSLLVLFQLAKQHGWLPTGAALRQLHTSLEARVRCFFPGGSRRIHHGV